ncbi:hypothetical protein [Acinetobacter baumannii]|uniref:hypothetical protein n=1 Tax=Acinetobacter baumannii TaxID=470 RepID=UPI000D6E03E2|nr:hypothetical protein [Acinetobacter baumannii]
MDEFFKKIDNSIGAQKKSKSDFNEMKKNNEEFFEHTSLRLIPILEQYVEEIKKRNIQVKSTSNKRYISVELKYKNGGYSSLLLSTNLESGRIEFQKNYTGDNGERFVSVDGSSYDERTWKDDIFKTKIEKLIEDFVFYAPRYGGF